MSTTSRAGITGTVTVHALLLGAVIWFGREVAQPIENVYAVTLIAAPAPDPATPTKISKPVTPVKSRDTAPILKPTKQPVKPEPKKPEPSKNTEKPTNPAVTPLPGQKPANGTDIANVKVEGLEGQYPEYIKNIWTQVYASWKNSGPHPNRTTVVLFTILPDGTVTSVSTGRTSSDFKFDSDAKATIEAIGTARSFGRLPGTLQEMKVSFTFKPDTP